MTGNHGFNFLTFGLGRIQFCQTRHNQKGQEDGPFKGQEDGPSHSPHRCQEKNSTKGEQAFIPPSAPYLAPDLSGDLQGMRPFDHARARFT